MKDGKSKIGDDGLVMYALNNGALFALNNRMENGLMLLGKHFQTLWI